MPDGDEDAKLRHGSHEGVSGGTRRLKPQLSDASTAYFEEDSKVDNDEVDSGTEYEECLDGDGRDEGVSVQEIVLVDAPGIRSEMTTDEGYGGGALQDSLGHAADMEASNCDREAPHEIPEGEDEGSGTTGHEEFVGPMNRTPDSDLKAEEAEQRPPASNAATVLQPAMPAALTVSAGADTSNSDNPDVVESDLAMRLTKDESPADAPVGDLPALGSNTAHPQQQPDLAMGLAQEADERVKGHQANSFTLVCPAGHWLCRHKKRGRCSRCGTRVKAGEPSVRCVEACYMACMACARGDFG